MDVKWKMKNGGMMIGKKEKRLNRRIDGEEI